MNLRPPPAPEPKTLIVKKKQSRNSLRVNSTVRPATALKTFMHAGDRGDILYSLPVIKYHGGGILYIYAAGFTREILTPEKWEPMRTLFLEQPYIRGVHPWNMERLDFNLNDFRTVMAVEDKERRFNIYKGLAERMCESHRVPLSALDEPWLEVSEKKKVAEVIFARSERYHSPFFAWKHIWELYHRNAVFIGLEDEHKKFCNEVGFVSHYKTKDFLEMTQVIAGATLFVGNQSAPYAVAEGLKQNAILEVWPDGPNCQFDRPNVWNGIQTNREFPTLESLKMKPTPFNEDYYMRGPETGVSNYTNYRWMPDLTRAMAAQIVSYIGAQHGDSILDWGCARGFLVRALRELGFISYGCDISEWAIASGDPTVKDFLFHPESLSSDTYDWVIAKDVFEHIPEKSLLNTVRNLSDRTHKGMFIVVPLTEEDGKPYICPRDNADKTHVNRWTLPTWINFLQELCPGFLITGTYHVPGIKQASEQWEKSCGFITAKKT